MQYRKSVLALCVALMAGHSAAHDPTPAARQSTKAQTAAKKSPLPARKSGLWEVTVRSDDLVLKPAGQVQRPLTVRQCTSAAVDPVMLMSVLPGQDDCHELKVKRRTTGGVGYQITTVCYVHDNRVNAQMELLGDLQSSYHGNFDVKYPEIPLNNTGRMVFAGRWLGACSANQRPGDMVLPNGVTVNVIDDRKRAEGHRHSHDHNHGKGESQGRGREGRKH